MDGGREELLLPDVFALVRGGVGESLCTGGRSKFAPLAGMFTGDAPGELGCSLDRTPLGLGACEERNSSCGEVGERGACDHRSKKLDTIDARRPVSHWTPSLCVCGYGLCLVCMQSGASEEQQADADWVHGTRSSRSC